MPYKEIHVYTSNSYDPANIVIGLNSPPYVDRFKLLRASIPLAFQSTDSSNNRIAFTRSGAGKAVSIPAGNYNAASFPPALQAAMNSVSNTQDFTVSYDSTANRLTINSPSAPVTILPFSQGTTLYTQLGMGKHDSALTGTTITFSGAPDFTSMAPLLLTSSTLVSKDVTFAGEEAINVLCMIDVTSPQNSVQNWVNHSGGWLDSGSTVSSIELRLLNANTLLPVQMSQPYSVSLGILTSPLDPSH
jgi:hypothetical protein